MGMELPRTHRLAPASIPPRQVAACCGGSASADRGQRVGGLRQTDDKPRHEAAVPHTVAPMVTVKGHSEQVSRGSTCFDCESLASQESAPPSFLVLVLVLGFAGFFEDEDENEERNGRLPMYVSAYEPAPRDGSRYVSPRVQEVHTRCTPDAHE